MISNERPSPFYRRAYDPARPAVNESTLRSAQVQIERKLITLTLKENPRGRFLRIVEEAGSQRNSIIVPAPGLEEFRNLVDEMLKASSELPAKGG